MRAEPVVEQVRPLVDGQSLRPRAEAMATLLEQVQLDGTCGCTPTGMKFHRTLDAEGIISRRKQEERRCVRWYDVTRHRGYVEEGREIEPARRALQEDLSADTATGGEPEEPHAREPTLADEFDGALSIGDCKWDPGLYCRVGTAAERREERLGEAIVVGWSRYSRYLSTKDATPRACNHDAISYPSVSIDKKWKAPPGQMITARSVDWSGTNGVTVGMTTLRTASPVIGAGSGVSCSAWDHSSEPGGTPSQSGIGSSLMSGCHATQI
jgi:hypothetical protein